MALVATPVTIFPLTAVATPVTMAPRGTTLTTLPGRRRPPPGPSEVGLVGAQAVCSTGFCTWVDLTDCMMMGEWVLACRALQACIELDLKKEIAHKKECFGSIFNDSLNPDPDSAKNLNPYPEDP